MSHISNFDTDAAKELRLATPVPQKVGKSVRDFFARKDACATPRRFAGQTASTPARKLKFAPDIIAGIEEDEYGGEAAKDLTGRVWRVFKVSPLFRFNENGPEQMVTELQVHLQSYINKLDSEEVLNALSTREGLTDPDSLEEENTQENLGKETNPPVMTSLRVKVDLVKGLRGHREDTEAMRLQIKQTLSKGKKEKVWSTCFLLSVDAQEATFFSKNVTQLPLCLMSGDNILGRQLLKGLEHRFDCIIFPLELPEDELMWMSTLWSSIPLPTTGQNTASAVVNNRSRKRTLSSNSCEAERPREEYIPMTEAETMPVKGDEIKFRYKLCEENMKGCGLDHLDVTFEGVAIRKLWQNVHRRNGSDQSEISKEEMERFHFALRSHVRKTIKLRLDDRSKFILTQTWLPILSASSNGHIRIERGCDRIKSILRELTMLCQGTTLTANPRVAALENVGLEVE